MKRLALAAGLLAAPAGARADALAALDLTLVVPPPPPADAAEAAVLAFRARNASPDALAAARADVDESVFLFADVLGPGFDARRLPLTADLFARLGEDASAAMNRAKAEWRRARPAAVLPGLPTCLPTPATPSYPNGHALLGRFYAAVLGAMLPERRAALFARARRYAEAREICGLHYPSDTEAGFLAASALAGAFLVGPDAAGRLRRALAELRPALGLPAEPPTAPALSEAPASEDFRNR